MKKTRRIFIFCIMLLLVPVLIVGDKSVSKDDLENQKAVTLIQHLIQSNIIPEENSSEYNASTYTISLNSFGGVYIDDHNDVVINTIDFRESEDLQMTIQSSQSNFNNKVILREVEFPLYEINENYNILIENGIMDLIGVRASYTDIIQNRIIIEVNSEFSSLFFEEKIRQMNINPMLVQFNSVTDKEELHFTAYIGNGLRKSSTTSYVCSIGFPAYKAGVSGFVTAGHCGGLGTTYYAPSGNSLGSITSRQLSGKVDAAWAPFVSENIPKAFIHNNNYTPYSQANTNSLVVGQSASTYTYNSPNTKNHTISSLNYAATVAGVTLTDFLKLNTSSNPVVPGDSGGGVSAITSGSRKLIGITSFSNGSTVAGISKVNNIATSLGLNP